MSMRLRVGLFVFLVALLSISCHDDVHDNSSTLLSEKDNLPDINTSEFNDEREGLKDKLSEIMEEGLISYHRDIKDGSKGKGTPILPIQDFASYLGFAWTAGCDIDRVDFEGQSGRDIFMRQENKSKDCKEASGASRYRWQDRTAYRFQNMVTQVLDIQLGKLKVAHKSPGDDNHLTASRFVFKNYEDKDTFKGNIAGTSSRRKSLTISSSQNFSTTHTIGIGSSISVSLETGIPLILKAKTDVSASFDYSSAFGESFTKSQSESIWESESLSASGSFDVEPCHVKVAEVLMNQVDYTIPYIATIATWAPQLEIEGFLRWSFHAHKDFGDGRPTVKAWFGPHAKSAVDINDHEASESLNAPRIAADKVAHFSDYEMTEAEAVDGILIPRTFVYYMAKALVSDDSEWDWQKIYDHYADDKKTLNRFERVKRALGVNTLIAEDGEITHEINYKKLYENQQFFMKTKEIKGEIVIKDQTDFHLTSHAQEKLPKEECGPGKGNQETKEDYLNSTGG